LAAEPPVWCPDVARGNATGRGVAPTCMEVSVKCGTIQHAFDPVSLRNSLIFGALRDPDKCG
jgi:hypothetical protein